MRNELMELLSQVNSEYEIDLSCLSPQKQAEIWAEHHKKKKPEERGRISPKNHCPPCSADI